MKKIFFLLLVLCALCSYGQKADFRNCLKYTAKELEPYYYSMGVYPVWINHSNYFWYDYTTSAGTVFYLVNAENGKKAKLFETEQLIRQLSRFTHKAYDPRNFRIGGLEFEGNNADVFTFSKDGHKFRYEIKSAKLEEIFVDKPCRFYPPLRPYWQKFSPDSNYMVYAWHHNLYLQAKGDTIPVQLTSDGEKYYSYGSQRDKDTDDKVSAAVTWAGNSKVFYCLRQDRRGVEDCWVIDHLAQPRPTLKTYKFPMPGEKRVFTYDLHLFYPDTKRHVVVDIAKYPDQEVKMMFFDFNKYPEYIYFTRKSRTCDRMDLCRVDVRTAVVTEVLSETSIPYFTEQLFECKILNGGEDIIWWSERTGKGHFYLYNKEGQMKNAITSGDFVACRISHLDTIGRWFIMEGYGREKGIDPNYRFYYRVNFDGSGFTLLTPGNGFHSIELSKNHHYLVDVYSRVDEEPTSVVRDRKGKEKVVLDRPDLSRLYRCGWKKPQRIVVKAADGKTDLYGVMYKPFQMDSTRKYPLITAVYPGPQEDQVPQSFTIDDFNQSLAQLGFIVINVGCRGGNMVRGRSFYNYGYGNLRDYALADNKYIIEQLADRYPFIDIDRVGIYGHSGGGFMAAAAILTYPDFYKVAVSASGNHDNNIYTKWWGEMYHGVKMEESKSKDGEKTYSFKSRIPTNIELARNLKGKLLLITGDVDINVHPANTIRLADALIKANKRFDMMLLPGKDHSVDSPYYFNLIRYYFVENLLGQRMENIDM